MNYLIFTEDVPLWNVVNDISNKLGFPSAGVGEEAVDGMEISTTDHMIQAIMASPAMKGMLKLIAKILHFFEL